MVDLQAAANSLVIQLVPPRNLPRKRKWSRSARGGPNMTCWADCGRGGSAGRAEARQRTIPPFAEARSWPPGVGVENTRQGGEPPAPSTETGEDLACPPRLFGIAAGRDTLKRETMGGAGGVGRRDGQIGTHADPLPIGAGHRILGACLGDEGGKAARDRDRKGVVGTAATGLADDGAAA